jgi:putative ABC transport system permease protein
MIRIAIKMLTGDRAKYIGILVGITFASLLITQQAAIFTGLMVRTYSFVTDTPVADIWVMDPEVEHHADAKPMLATELQRVRSVEGVAWAVPMFKTFARMRLPNGALRNCILIGVDDFTLIGAPQEMVRGTVDDLRRTDGVIVDEAELGKKLAMFDRDPGTNRRVGEGRPVKVGDTLELNDRRAQIVGTFKGSPSFFWEPTIYTTYSRAIQFLPQERRQTHFILVKGAAGHRLEEVMSRIESQTGMAAYTNAGFKWLTASYILEKTGIAINFGIAVLLGFFVGAAIAGQTFHNYTLDNLRYFGALKAMGAGDWTLLRMIVTQSLTAGAIGLGLGIGAATIFGTLVKDSDLAFRMEWWLLALTAAAVLTISVLSAAISLRRVLTLEPAVVFKG